MYHTTVSSTTEYRVEQSCCIHVKALTMIKHDYYMIPFYHFYNVELNICYKWHHIFPSL